MINFQTKPIVIQAVLCKEALRAFAKDWKALPKWLADHYENGGVVAARTGVYLTSPHGSILARPEDWIVCGADGSIFPCSPETFAATYDPTH